jgi:hypothetical protein
MTIFNVIDFIITGCVHSLVMWVWFQILQN